MTEETTTSDDAWLDETHSVRTAPSLRLARVEVDQLFDLYDHEVTLHTDDRVTVIHGPNGVGKTMLLRMIAAFFAGDYLEFKEIPFKEFRLFFLDESFVRLRRSTTLQTRQPKQRHFFIDPLGGEDEDDDDDDDPADVESVPLLEILVHNTRSGTNEITHTLDARNLHSIHLHLNALPSLTQIGADAWRLLHGPGRGRKLSTKQAWHLFRLKLPQEIQHAGLFDDPQWLSSMRSRASVHFIETQRLTRPSRTSDALHTSATVNECSRELVRQMRFLTQKYAVISQALDSSFPRRFLSAGRGEAQPTAALLERLKALEEQRKSYRSIGLMRGKSEDDVTFGATIDEDKVDALAMLISDMERKLRVFVAFHRRVTTLINRANGKFRNKSISLNRNGLSLIGRDGQAIGLSALSSGEQHELVLLYELLFKVEPNGLVLIDEPELSLHLQWQKAFMSDLLAIVGASSIDVLLATHSPYIAGDRTDLMEPLDIEQG